MNCPGVAAIFALVVLGTASAQTPTWTPSPSTDPGTAPAESSAPEDPTGDPSASTPATDATAQEPSAPPVDETSPAAPPTTQDDPRALERGTVLQPERGATLLDQQRTSSQRRWSRFSAGSGGPLYVFTELLAGVTTGAMVGGEVGGKDGAYLGAVSSGAFFGALSAIDQYYRPVGQGTASMIALANGAGFLAGFGIASLADLEDKEKMWTIFGTTHAASLAAVLATWAVDDVSAGDASLIGMTSTYAFALTGLVLLIIDADRGDVSPASLLLAPAVGMGIGAAMAPFVYLRPGRALLLTGLPLGVGATLLAIGQLADNKVIAPATALAGTVTTLGLAILFTGEPPAPVSMRAAEEEPAFAFIPMIQPAGRRNEGMAVGPGVVGSF